MTMCPRRSEEIDDWEHRKKSFQLEISAERRGLTKEGWPKKDGQNAQQIITRTPGKCKAPQMLYQEYVTKRGEESRYKETQTKDDLTIK